MTLITVVWIAKMSIPDREPEENALVQSMGSCAAISVCSSAAVAQDVTTLTPEIVTGDGLPSAFAGPVYSPNVGADFPDLVLFGDMHVHTMLSADAGGAGASLLPDDAYRFALGEEVVSTTGQRVRLSRPLDFFMLTEHSDGMGVILDILNGAPNIMAEPVGAALHEAFSRGGTDAQNAVWEMIALFANGELPDALLYQPGNPAFDRVWLEIIDAAERHYVPGEFTTFVAFEWTPFVNGNNLHRNVIFRDGYERVSQIAPFTTTPPVGSQNPRDLWAWMQAYEDKTGGEVMAVPHNGNLSNGIMFPLVDTFDNNTPLDAEYARLRQTWEPLYEVTQVKGDGEAHPYLSPDDPFADYETWDFGNLDMSEAKTPDMLAGEYARSGFCVASNFGRSWASILSSSALSGRRIPTPGLPRSTRTISSASSSVMSPTPTEPRTCHRSTRSLGWNGSGGRTPPRGSPLSGHRKTPASPSTTPWPARGLCHDRPAHPGSAVRGVGFCPRCGSRARSGRDRIFGRGADGL